MRAFHTLLGTPCSQAILKVVIGEVSSVPVPAAARTGLPQAPRGISGVGMGPRGKPAEGQVSPALPSGLRAAEGWGLGEPYVPSQ